MQKSEMASTKSGHESRQGNADNVARSLQRAAATPAADSAAGGPALLVGFLAFVVLTVGFAVGITWWFRRDERHVQGRLAEALTREFQPPPPDDAPEAENLDGLTNSEALKTSQTPLPGQLFAPRFTKDPNIREDAD